MIREFVLAWEASKHRLRERFAEKHPESYGDVVRGVVEMIASSISGLRCPDPEYIAEAYSDSRSGDAVYVIASKNGQGGVYWYVRVAYGSCRQCDTLDGIRSESAGRHGKPNTRQVEGYMTLALHIVQGIKELE